MPNIQLYYIFTFPHIKNDVKSHYLGYAGEEVQEQ